MDPKRWQRIQEVFDQVADMPRDERDRALKEACGDDADLLEQVTKLLLADDENHSLLDGKAMDAMGDVAPTGPSGGGQARPGAVDVGSMVGQYKVVDIIASGGMGSVFLAERADGEFQQQVALKVIRGGVNSEGVIRRFRGERQILARLDHPHIARLLDGGVTESGEPFFTMEYVAGEPIDSYCDHHRLNVDQRLQLIETACEAVAYAQQNLVVHRDIKPSNILVADDGSVKLLDFGIAKVMDDDDDGVEHTKTGMRIMTPGYAAPEQVLSQPATTATDVYSLGVVMYELLTGHRPYQLETTAQHELERAILEQEPARPSTVVVRETKNPATGSTTGSGKVSAARSMQPDQLRRKLDGDLDNICLKALSKEPHLRYANAEQLLRDIRNYREGLPVSARRPTFAYQAKKFVQRNRAGVLSAAAALIAVIALVTFYTAQLTRERDRARSEAKKANTVADFLTDMFKAADPYSHGGEEITAKQMLNTGRERLDALAGEPEVQTRMMAVIGQAYYHMADYSNADSVLSAGMRILEERGEDDSYGYFELVAVRARLLTELGDYDGAVALTAEQTTKFHHAFPDSFGMRGVLVNEEARAWNGKGNYPAADSLYTIARANYRKANRRESESSVMNNHALLLHEMQKYPEARALFEEGLSIQREIFTDHPELATTLYNYGQLLRDMGEYDRAEEILLECLAMDKKINGDRHPDVAYSLRSLAILYQGMGKYDKAEEYYLESYSIRREFYGDEHPEVAYAINSIARVAEVRGHYAKAESLYTVSLEMHRRVHGEEHPVIAIRTDGMANLMNLMGRYAEAESMAVYSLAKKEKTYDEDNFTISLTLQFMATAVQEQGRVEEAEPIYRRAAAAAEATKGKHHLASYGTKRNLAMNLIKLGKLEEAFSLLTDGLAGLNEIYGEKHLRTAGAHMALARYYAAQGDWPAAAESAEIAVEIREELGDDHPSVATARILLGWILEQAGEEARGRQLMDRGAEVLRAAGVRETNRFLKLASGRQLAPLIRAQHSHKKAVAPAASEKSTSAADVETSALSTSKVNVIEDCGEPNLYVSSAGAVYLSYVRRIDKGYALEFRECELDGNSLSWGTPVRVASGLDWFVNWADRPGVIVEGKRVFASWLVKSGPDTYAYDVMFSQSNDGARVWTEPKSLHDDGTLTEHGFVSRVLLPNDNVLVVWLDGRNYASSDDGPMTLRSAEVSPGGVVSNQRVIDDSVCDCCSTSLTLTKMGAAVAYRDRSDNETRDIFVARYDGETWSEPVAVHNDEWVIAGCPVNGPSIRWVEGWGVDVAWYTAAGGKPMVRLARSVDSGRSFKPWAVLDDDAPLGQVGLTSSGVIWWGKKGLRYNGLNWSKDNVTKTMSIPGRSVPSFAWVVVADGSDSKLAGNVYVWDRHDDQGVRIEWTAGKLVAWSHKVD